METFLNKFIYEDQVVYFGTKHDKEKLLAPLFLECQRNCVGVPIDTDVFGTFSGEVERKGTVIETLRKKVLKTADACPRAVLIVASEGSFAPHPFIPFIDSNMEALLFWDRIRNHEIYVDIIE